MTSKSKSDDSVDGDFLSNNWNGDESHLGLDGDVDGYPPGGRQAKAPGVSSHHKGGPRSTGKLNILRFKHRKNCECCPSHYLIVLITPQCHNSNMSLSHCSHCGQCLLVSTSVY